MAIKLMDTIETAGDFPVINSPSVGVPGNKRLNELIDETGKVKTEALPDDVGGSDPRLDSLLTDATETIFDFAVTDFQDDGGGRYSATSDTAIPLEVGATYYVTLNYAYPAYEVTAFAATIGDYGECVAIGNGPTYGYPGNNEPFFIASNAEGTLFAEFDAPADSLTNHHIVKIEKKSFKVDEKYLPEYSGGSDSRLDEMLDSESGKIKDEYLPESSGGGGCSCPTDLMADTETEVLAAQTIETFTLDPTFGYCVGTAPGIFTTPLVVGKKYNVVWDGETYNDLEAYTVTNETFGELVTIGDGSSLGYPGNGEPFVVSVNENVALFLAFTDPAESHNVAVSEVAVKVNESYLPEAWVKSYVDKYVEEALGGEY